MPYSTDGVKIAAYRNIFTTEEVCNIIGRTRQQLNNLIKNGDIEVFKSTTNGNLFWRPEVYELLRKINRERPRESHHIYGSTTDKSLKAFKELNLDVSKVEQVYVFFNHRDAILKNFYNIEDVEMPDTLTNVDGARFIIIMEDNTEYWFDGLTCGYSGTGCVGTEKVLSAMGIIEKGDPINEIIPSYRILHFWREDGKWLYEGEDSIVEEHEIDIFSEKNLIGIEENFYRFNGRLVLTQGARYRKVFGEVQEPSTEVLLKSLYFVPDPVSVEFLSEEEAIASGHFSNTYGETIIYQIVIRDVSDRELWLNYPFKQLPEKKQRNMKELMEFLGVKIDLEGECVPHPVLNWFRKRPRTIYGAYKLEEK